jgi:hypothetical protein
MTIRTNQNDPWHDPNFQPNAGPASSDDFAQPRLSGSSGLRDFIQRETHANISDNRTSETLAKGIYLRRLRDGTYELLVYRGRSCYYSYPAETREELLEFSKNFIQEP